MIPDRILPQLEFTPMNNFLRIGAAQFPVSHDMDKNYKYIEKLIKKASDRHVEVLHFPETALPGYLSFPRGNPGEFDWNTLDSLTEAICNLALSYSIWIILGSIRRKEGQLPRNCISVISDSGKIIGYYDKQRIYKPEVEYYSPGKSPFVVSIKGYKCGFLICYDNCFPELYSIYRAMGTVLIFHSMHNAGNKNVTSIKDLIAANLIVRSADNQFWISASNSSQSYCPCPSTIVRPDGSAIKAKRHVTSIAIDDFPKAKLGWTYDNTTF